MEIEQSAIETINNLSEQVEKDFNKNKAITSGAYKFLHYHLMYIEDKLK